MASKLNLQEREKRNNLQINWKSLFPKQKQISNQKIKTNVTILFDRLQLITLRQPAIPTTKKMELLL